MKLKKLLSLLFVFAMVTACSNNETTDAEGEDEAIASEEADFVVDSEGEDELSFEDEENGESFEDEEVVADASEAQDQEDVMASQEDEYVEQPVAIDGGNGVGTYTVKKGDTLMLIAFKTTGDYDNWAAIKRMNGLSSSRLTPGQTLKYNMPATPFVWNPEGLPYLIMRGDTLASISQDKYGTIKKWRSIYNNNKPMIKNPNLIFAGFTLYYLPDNRDLASE